MKRLITFFAVLSVMMMVSMQLIAQNSKTKSKEEKTIYGFSVYDSQDYDKFGIVTFDIANPGTTTLKYRLEDGYKFDQASAATFAKGKYYVFADDAISFNPKSFGAVNLETGDREIIKTLAASTPKFADITYDYSTSTMYGIQGDTKLVTINLGNGEVQNKGNFNIAPGVMMLTIASTYEGQLYGITSAGHFVSINKETAKVTLIGATGMTLNPCTQSMDFDHKTGRLYWTGYKGWPDEQGFFAEVNITTGTPTIIGNFSPNAQIIGLYIPFELNAEDSPAAVSNLSIIPAQNGKLEASLSWVNPSKTFSGQELTELSGVNVYCDGELIGVVNSSSIGENATYTHIPTTSSLKNYEIEPFNSAGAGVVTKYNAFVGRDVPSAPTDVVLTKEDLTAIINWTAPSIGVNGGWIDVSTLKYSITRLPDSTVLSTNTTTNSFTDETITVQSGYSYQVQSITNDGKGGLSTSNVLVIGSSITTPYFCTFATEEEFNQWTVIDANQDNVTWKMQNGYNSVSYGGAIANDWLISPSIYLEAGKKYKLLFNIKKGIGEEIIENIRVSIGKSTTAEGQSTIVSDFPDFTTGLKAVTVNVEESGVYNIGFYCYSPKNMTPIELSNISLKEQLSTDLTAIGIESEYTVAPLNVKLPYTITVENIGQEDVHSYSVELLDEDWAVLATKNITEVIPAGDKVKIVVEYAELYTKGDKLFLARVNAPDDSEWQNDVTEEGMTIKFIDSYQVKGKIVTENGDPISNANVRIEGDYRQSAITLSDGTFKIDNVMVSNEYKISFYKFGFKSKTQNLKVIDQDVDLGTISLQTDLLSPTNIDLETIANAITVNWTDVATHQNLRHDSGIVGGAFGPFPPFVGLNTIVGVAYNYPIELNKVSWLIDDYTGQHETINIVILELDSNGLPTNKTLAIYENVPNKDNIFYGSSDLNWNTFQLPTPIQSHNGVLVSISCNKAFTTYVDNTHETANGEFPFKPNTNFYSEDFQTGDFRKLEDIFVASNLLIRAEGKPLYISESAQEIVGYKVSRLKSGEELTPNKWTSLTAEPISETTLVDNSWNTLDQGLYKYALQTIYTNDRASKHSISTELAKNMSAKITITANTNTPVNAIEGALVTLQNADINSKLSYSGNIDSNGKIAFNDVFKGNYTVSIHRVGFVPCIDTIDVTSSENEYSFGTYTLKEDIIKPYNLKIDKTDDETQRQLTWSVEKTIQDDFEKHSDFAINSAGTIGWQAIDVDNAYTYPLGNVSFPNAESRMAYIIFNPSQTTPPCTGPGFELLQTHSGNKYLAFMPALLKDNNDFFVSPELNFKNDFTLSFYALSPLGVAYGLEKMRVGYSTTDILPSSFQWLHETEFIEVPDDKWTLFEFTVPANAKYVTINCVSTDQYMLSIDDIFIGNSTTNTLVGCELFLDDVSCGTTTDFNYTFVNITPENKTLGVRSLYASGSSEIVKVEIDPVSVIEKTDLMPNIYPNPAKNRLFIDGNYTFIEIYDMTGKKVLESEQNTEIDVTQLNNGIYTLKIHNQGTIVTHKVVIKK